MLSETSGLFVPMLVVPMVVVPILADQRAELGLAQVAKPVRRGPRSRSYDFLPLRP